MRIAIIGQEGQLARCLADILPPASCSFLGRPALDLARPGTIGPALDEVRPDIVVNAAAYTAVDAAEEDADTAFAVNAAGAGALAAGAARLGVPIVHVSTDYVFDGTKTTPYAETDPVAPLGVYGASKLAGERAVAAANPRALILRTAWVYSAYGRNFVRTMLRLAAAHDEVRVVDDQHGTPASAASLAGAVATLLPRLVRADADDWGVYHYAGAGETSWAGFARAIFAGAVARGLIAKAPKVVPIPTSEFPTPAARPARSVLDCGAFTAAFGIAMVPWQTALADVLDRLAAREIREGDRQ